MSAGVCELCRRGCRYRVVIGGLAVCEECTDRAWKRAAVLTDCSGLSSGTLATLSGFSHYETLGQLQTDLLLFAAAGAFGSWDQAWSAFWKVANRPMVAGVPVSGGMPAGVYLGAPGGVEVHTEPGQQVYLSVLSVPYGATRALVVCCDGQVDALFPFRLEERDGVVGRVQQAYQGEAAVYYLTQSIQLSQERPVSPVDAYEFLITWV